MTLDAVKKNSKRAKEVERSDPRKAFQDAWTLQMGVAGSPSPCPQHTEAPKRVRGKIHAGPMKMGEIKAKDVRAS